MVNDAIINASCSGRKGKEPIVMIIDVTAHLNPFEDDLDFDKYELGFDDGMSAVGTKIESLS